MARRAAIIKEQRQKSSNVLLLDAGNTLLGQPLADRTRGRVVVEAMNKLGYNAMALGDREFDQSTKTVYDRSQEAKFPFLSANIVDPDTNRLVGKPYTIVTIGGRKIGLVGLTSLMTSFPQSHQSKLVEQDYLTAARETVEKLKKETSAIIVLSNLGLDREQQLARQVSGISLIVGGGPGGNTPEPVVVGPNGTAIVRAGPRGEEMGIWNLSIDAAGKVGDLRGEILVLYQDKYPEDPEMLQLLASFKSQ